METFHFLCISLFVHFSTNPTLSTVLNPFANGAELGLVSSTKVHTPDKIKTRPTMLLGPLSSVVELIRYGLTTASLKCQIRR
ncbi:hypothetical protein L208DRAFT_1406255 [Tricholoma matsutake]|nr:hypothetical protein L208DRAFT_1406255 [Tricholoma matsutake 945]